MFCQRETWHWEVYIFITRVQEYAHERSDKKITHHSDDPSPQVSWENHIHISWNLRYSHALADVWITELMLISCATFWNVLLNLFVQVRTCGHPESRNDLKIQNDFENEYQLAPMPRPPLALRLYFLHNMLWAVKQMDQSFMKPDSIYNYRLYTRINTNKLAHTRPSNWSKISPACLTRVQACVPGS